MKRIDVELRKRFTEIPVLDTAPIQVRSQVDFERKTVVGASRLAEMQFEEMLANIDKPLRGVAAIWYLKELLQKNNIKIFKEFKDPQEENESNFNMVRKGFTKEAAKCFIPIVFAKNLIEKCPEYKYSPEVCQLLEEAIEGSLSLKKNTKFQVDVVLKINEVVKDIRDSTNFNMEVLRKLAILNREFPEQKLHPMIDRLEPLINRLDVKLNMHNSDIPQKEANIQLVQVLVGWLGFPELINPEYKQNKNLSRKKLNFLVESYNGLYLKALAYTAAAGFYFNYGDKENARNNYLKAEELMKQDLVSCGVNSTLVTMAKENLRKLELKMKGKDLVL